MCGCFRPGGTKAPHSLITPALPSPPEPGWGTFASKLAPKVGSHSRRGSPMTAVARGTGHKGRAKKTFFCCVFGGVSLADRCREYTCVGTLPFLGWLAGRFLFFSPRHLGVSLFPRAGVPCYPAYSSTIPPQTGSLFPRPVS